jgi:hypothetical protein
MEVRQMPDTQLPDIAYLRQRFRYEPETGKLYWRPHAAASRAWNTRYAGVEAAGAHNAGYFRVSLDGVKQLAHRVAWAVHFGVWPTAQIDHINGDRRDNRVLNLRAVSNAVNSRNAACPKNNTSTVVGVAWVPKRQKWLARIMTRNANKFLGYYDNIEDATTARKNAEKQFGFHENHGRTRTS